MNENRPLCEYFWVCNVCFKQADLDIAGEVTGQYPAIYYDHLQCDACRERGFDEPEIHAVVPSVFAGVIHRLYGCG